KEAKTDSLGSLLGETFTFERTNPRKTETTSIGALIKTILTLKKVIQEVGNFIQGFKPQIGWKFDFTMEICAGSFTYEWGYKEWVDHTIYRWWHIDISLTLLSVKLEVSFGIGLKLGRLALVGSIYGSTVSEVGIKRDLQADPDRRPTWTMPLHGKVSGELGVRLVLGDEWAMAKGFFRAGFPMEATCVCKPPEPFYIEWRVDYTGLDAVLHCSTKWFGGFDQRFVLSQPIYNYKSGNFFKAQRPRGKK
ncbi:MAG TPA: hypothetical protein VK459_19490, partial [Polyangiaceae bacterium]|nr:hypothetical protein [Polyangiaceae bacterium]